MLLTFRFLLQFLVSISCVLLAILFLGQILLVFGRYFLDLGSVRLQDAVSYSFAGLVALSVAVAFIQDKHVRVDVFRERLSQRSSAYIEILGCVFLVFPTFGLMLWYAIPHVHQSWSILEGSPEAGGLPGFFLVKSCLVILPALIVVVAMRRILVKFVERAE